VAAYVELHCHSAFSLCDGVASPEALAERAAQLGMPSLALTDHDNLHGAVVFQSAAKRAGIQPIFGAELTLADSCHLTLLVENARGWANLCQLISIAKAQAPKGQASLPFEALREHADGLICLSGCRQGPIATARRERDRTRAYQLAKTLRSWFGPERFCIELQHHLAAGDAAMVQALADMADLLQLRAVVTNNVHYLRRADQPLHDVLTAIRHRTSRTKAGPLLRPNSEHYLKTAAQLAPLFPAYPQALSNSLRIAERCRFTLDYGLQELPRFPTPAGCSAADYLAKLCRAALPQRYDAPAEHVLDQLVHELAVIERAGLANYLLIVWDIVCFARSHGIPCQGRGSAANSLVAYLLGISLVDPIAHALVFERFLSDERRAVPDIDLDIAAHRRSEVIQHVYQTYGDTHAAMACTFATFRTRSANRDLARVLELPASVMEQVDQEGDTSPDSPVVQVRHLRDGLIGLPRHIGQHSGGMVLTREPLASRVPTEPTAMEGRTVVRWDKDSIEDAGLIKIDLLGLRMLSAIQETCEHIEAATGRAPDLTRLTYDDEAIYHRIRQADTIGCFQIESRAQAQMLPALKPREFADLVVGISLIRPGPLQGNMVHPFLRRRQGLEPVRYPHPVLEPVLKETLGVILFQEQVLRVAEAVAGFTLGQGEQLRRVLAKPAGPVLTELRQQFVAGAEARGIARHIAVAIFRRLEGFAGYSFPKSHACAFASIVYQSAWLKYRYPAHFLVGLMNHQPLGFWAPAVLVGDAERHGVAIVPLDIHRSEARCSLDRGAVRLGLNSVLGLGEAGAARIANTRQTRAFADLEDFCRRTQLPQRLVGALIKGGAFDAWNLPRRLLLWELAMLRYTTDELDLPIPTTPVQLPTLEPEELLAMETSVLGFSVGPHLMALRRERFAAQGYVASWELPEHTSGLVRVAGVLVMHQAPPTAKGTHFLSLEDEGGLINIIVPPHIVERDMRQLRGCRVVLVQGAVEQRGPVVNLVARRIATLDSHRR
jgi:error-prone DNA polymerase